MYEWFVPITILPGVALLVLSTSNLLINLSDEISQLLQSEKHAEILIAKKKLKQLNLLNLAMVGLYFGAANFVVSAILAIQSETLAWCYKASIYSISGGIIAVLVSLCFLVIFSFKAVTIRKNQFLDKNKKL